MDKPYYELYGEGIGYEGFDSLEDAIEFGNSNCNEYVIYMKLKIEEKKK